MVFNVFLFSCPIFFFLKGPKRDSTYAYICHLPIMLIASLSDLFSMSGNDTMIYLYIWKQIYILLISIIY